MIRRVAIARFVAPLQHLHPLEDHDDAEYYDADDAGKNDDYHYYQKQVAIARFVSPLQHLHPLEDHDDAEADATDEAGKR